MKVVLGLLVLLGVGYVAVYHLGGYGSFDPSAQGQERRSKIEAGMSYAKVFDEITGDPHKYRIINLKKHRNHGQESEELVPSAEVDFDRPKVDDHFKKNELPHGFTVTFIYSSSVAFTITFDGQGKVAALGDALTQADMFQLRKPAGKVIEPGLGNLQAGEEDQDADEEEGAEADTKDSDGR